MYNELEQLQAGPSVTKKPLIHHRILKTESFSNSKWSKGMNWRSNDKQKMKMWNSYGHKTIQILLLRYLMEGSWKYLLQTTQF
jgi:hypothetical protein